MAWISTIISPLSTKSSPKGKKIVTELKKISKTTGKVFLATDYDREGEAIAWHLKELLGVPEERIFRITFHEITPEAIYAALQSPRKVDHDLVDAQVARRVLDRIVGYRLSPLLWEKIKKGLSAGRVQSVAVRLICEREDEIEKFKPQEYWSVDVQLKNTQQDPFIPFIAHLNEWEGKKVQKLDIGSKEQADKIVQQLENSSYSIHSLKFKEKKRSPLPPFMTSTLAQESSRKCGFSAQRTMRIAQSLYEGIEISGNTVGLITYMRTDSLNIAQAARKEAQEFILKRFGKPGLPEKVRTYKTKSKGAQEAHEAIRPTSAFRDPDSLKSALTPDQFKLYNIIWQRFIASQMSDALYDTVSAEIKADPKDSSAQVALLRSTGSTLKKAGFLEVYGEESESEETADHDHQNARGKLPHLSEKEQLDLMKTIPEQHFTEPPPRYNEASLIKALEQDGIGRPSTYAPTIETILYRAYVRLNERRFYPTELGRIVNRQLTSHFPGIVDTHFTATLEEKLDKIAEGNLDWTNVMEEFYHAFETDLKKASETMKKIEVAPKDSGETCPTDQGKLLIRESRFGKYLSCENFPKCRYKVSLDTNGKKIVPEEIDEKCQKCQKPMVVKMSRRGKFLACSGYPDCKNTISIDRNGNKIIRPEPKETDLKCEKSGHMMLLRFGARGPFLACSGFPKCRNIKKPPQELVEKLAPEHVKKKDD